MIAKVMVTALVVVLVSGCAGLGKGPSDQELVMNQITALKEGLLAKDIDKVMGTISESFYHPEAGDKATIKEFLQQGIDMGYLDNGEVNLDNVKITIEGDTATAYPIEASSSAGSATAELKLKKEDKGWFIVGGDAEGV